MCSKKYNKYRKNIWKNNIEEIYREIYKKTYKEISRKLYKSMYRGILSRWQFNRW